jgi:hypothetical protein
MSSPINNKRASRVYSGLSPELYDRIDYSYPDALTTRLTYSFDEVSDVPTLAGIVDCVYSDPTKTTLLSKTRIV